jgi:competence ComEA-like helix-hairpin-helix protein
LPKPLPRPALLLLCALACLLTGPPGGAGELRSIDGARLIPTDWADGDSFEVEFPNGERHTIRLYGAYAIELHVSDKTDARRLRAQRRHFGITDYSDQVPESIALAKSLGAKAKTAVQALLAEPFTVHTAFADGGGDGRYKRIYGFITLPDGRDLATVLVGSGLARAYGVYRTTPDGLSRDDYRERLQDVELRAAAGRQGAWAYTDWDRLPAQREDQRREDRELDAATGKAPPTRPLDINTAARDELMRIPGIGEHFANAIIENRPYRKLEDLLRVPGIGEKRLGNLREWVSIQP